jgi:uncharacterized protein involved in exopolysaccharide biosynthesis
MIGTLGLVVGLLLGIVVSVVRWFTFGARLKVDQN